MHARKRAVHLRRELRELPHGLFFLRSRAVWNQIPGVPWVAEKRERCTESGILMEEFEESEDDEDPNKPGPVEAYAFRACGKACGTCE